MQSIYVNVPMPQPNAPEGKGWALEVRVQPAAPTAGEAKRRKGKEEQCEEIHEKFRENSSFVIFMYL